MLDKRSHGMFDNTATLAPYETGDFDNRNVPAEVGSSRARSPAQDVDRLLEVQTGPGASGDQGLTGRNHHSKPTS